MWAESESTESIARTPSIVFSSTGQMQPEMMTTTFIESVMPISSIRTGISTGGGIARKNSSTGSVKSRSHLTEPISRPAAIPITIAATTPTSRRPIEGNTSETIRSPNQVSANASAKVAGVGTKKFVVPSVEAHQIRTRMTGRASP